MSNKSEIKLNFMIQFLALMIYLIFCYSVIYNYAYFWALGINLARIPINVSDIVNTAFTWVPFVTITAGVGLLFLLITKRIEQGMTEEEIVNSTSNPDRIRKIREMPFILMEWLSIILTVSFILLGQLSKYLSIAFLFLMIFWFWFGRKLSDHPRIIQRRNIILKLSIVFIPIITGFVFTRGYDDAIDKISKMEPDAVVQLTNDNKISAVILRNFDKGILLKRINNNSIRFVLWQDINSIDLQYKETFYQGLLCKWIKPCPAELLHRY